MAASPEQPGDALISELKQRLLARAVPRLCHDLNNDLTVISGQAELAQRQGSPRLQERMERIKLAARHAHERHLLLQQLERDGSDARVLTPGAAIADEIQRLAALLTQRNVVVQVAAQGPLPRVDRTRLRWITGAVLISACASEGQPVSRLTLTLTQSEAGLHLDCEAEGVPPPPWLAATLQHCALAAEVGPNGNGWRTAITLSAAS